jgi:hypothetical protein
MSAAKAMRPNSKESATVSIDVPLFVPDRVSPEWNIVETAQHIPCSALSYMFSVCSSLSSPFRGETPNFRANLRVDFLPRPR